MIIYKIHKQNKNKNQKIKIILNICHASEIS